MIRHLSGVVSGTLAMARMTSVADCEPVLPPLPSTIGRNATSQTCFSAICS